MLSYVVAFVVVVGSRLVAVGKLLAVVSDIAVVVGVTWLIVDFVIIAIAEHAAVVVHYRRLPL